MNNADQLAEIRPGLREALSGGENVCVTFQVEELEERWVQYVDGIVNAAHFMADSPDISKIPATLHESLGRISLVGWEPFKFIALEVGRAEVDPLAKLIDWIFTELQGCEVGEYHLDVSVENI